ncbi:MAG: type II secretion system protein N [Burkholderiales bacterium]
MRKSDDYSGARIAAGFATLVALALLAAAVGWWGWQAFGPAPVRIVPAAPADPVAAILASGLGATPGAPPAPAAPAKDDAALASGDTRLLGVFAERDGRGYALFRLPAGPRLVAAGQEIAQGATLVDVRPDGITVRDAGGERRIALRGEPRAKPVAVPIAAAKAARSPACAVPANFKGTVLRLNAELFQGIIAKPESWAALVMPDGGALAVRDDSGFMAMLAMRKGDRLQQANGVALAVPDDVIRAVLQPLAAQQPVRVVGARGGTPREWLLLNAGSCPG